MLSQMASSSRLTLSLLIRATTWLARPPLIQLVAILTPLFPMFQPFANRFMYSTWISSQDELHGHVTELRNPDFELYMHVHALFVCGHISFRQTRLLQNSLTQHTVDNEALMPLHYRACSRTHL